MKRFHFFAGIIITLFVGVHLFNHLISILGEEAHIKAMESLRPIYRNVLVETLLLIAVIVQIISGVTLFFFKRKSVNTFYEKVQIWTGLYLAAFLIIHLSAVMSGRYLLHLDTNFYFGVAGLNTFPLNLFFVPYYALAIISFFGHISAIHYLKMKRRLCGLSVKQQSAIILGIGIVVTVAIFYGLTNGFSGVEIPKEFHVIIGR